MLMLSRLGKNDAKGLRVFIDAVGAAVDQQLRRLGDEGFNQIEAIIDRQAALLEGALVKRAKNAESGEPTPAEPLLESVAKPLQLHASDIDGMTAEQEVPGCNAQVDDEPPVPLKAHRAPRQPSGYVPNARSMEEKLKEERKPVQKLLMEDCVAAGLVDKNKAAELVSIMSGKTPEAAELEIVEVLREVLQLQVKHFMRKSKGGPWQSPRVQNDLRKDIHGASTVRGILMLARQILKERRQWEKEHGRIGILGLFAARR